MIVMDGIRFYALVRERRVEEKAVDREVADGPVPLPEQDNHLNPVCGENMTFASRSTWTALLKCFSL
jgi:hypothetical protein